MRKERARGEDDNTYCMRYDGVRRESSIHEPHNYPEVSWETIHDYYERQRREYERESKSF
jgi:hypothetical protein